MMVFGCRLVTRRLSDQEVGKECVKCLSGEGRKSACKPADIHVNSDAHKGQI